MDGVSPWRKLRELGVEVPVEFAVLPPIVLDSTDWVLGPGNDLLTHYIAIRCLFSQALIELGPLWGTEQLRVQIERKAMDS